VTTVLGVRKPAGRRGQNAVVPLIAGWTLLGFITALLIFIVYMTFVPGLPTDGGWTLVNWESLATPYFLTRVLPNTVLLGLGSICIATLFGLPIAWLVNRTDLPMRRGFATAMALILVIPGYASAMGWILLVDERIGLINAALRAALHVPNVPLTISNNVYGMIWVMGLILAPAIFFLVAGPIRSLDPALEEAARMSGADPVQTFWRVDLPLIWPAVLGALIYTFITAVSIFEVPALLGAASGKVPVLATALFYAVRPAGPQTGSFAYGVAGVYGLVLIVPSLIATAFYLRLLDRVERYQVVSGKGYRPHDVRLGRLRGFAVAFVVLYFVLALLLPLAILFWASLVPVLEVPALSQLVKMTPGHYAGLLQTLGGGSVITNTLILVVTVSVLVTFFSLMISWVVVRTQLRQRKLMDILSMIPHAVPGLAFAFAFAMLGILASRSTPWLPFAGTIVIIILADLIVRLPYGTRLANASLAQVHRELEEAARMSGATTGATMLRVLVPLIKPSIVYLAVWTGLLTLQEVSMALFLSGPQNLVLSVSIFQLWTDGNLGPAAAGTVVLTIVLAAVTWTILRLTDRVTSGIVK
jgi:iron(III) transport system permease protein